MNWQSFILSNEVAIRLGFFFGVLVIIALWEVKSPRRPLSQPKLLRWTHNLGLVFLNSAILRLLFPAAAVGVALFAQDQQWGLFNYFSFPLLFSAVISVILMDAVIYLQHVMAHAVPLLWRLHRVHHADMDYDVTTGARFHPIEIILSMLIKFATILLLGPPVVAVVIFEVLLNATAMFNHGNLKLPARLDSLLRLFVVTPDMHRVHHSVDDDETNSNFGFNLPWWDRLFGTYKAQPRAGHEGMTIGIDHFRDPGKVERIWGMLMLPFSGDSASYTINRRSWKKGSD
ncbi:MAG: sterol desaturase family protein [Sedimenticola sp.]|nr:sterol desaturase family protein [Sedimenticola sp.]